MILAAKPLMDFIAQPESGGDYNIVWGGIQKKDRPPKPLVKMTIGEVLAWQDSIDRLYNSEAAGRYQIMEDTLRGLYRDCGLTSNDLFDENGQDTLAYGLLRRRGLEHYLEGRWSVERFCNSLAMEWASLPVVQDLTRKDGSIARRGASYYDGDGLNKSHVSVDAFLSAVKAIRDRTAVKPALPAPAWWQAIFDAIATFLKGLKR